MKAILTHDWNNNYCPVGEILTDTEVEVVEGMETDADGVYNAPYGMCYLCRLESGEHVYIPATYLQITDMSKTVDWEQRRYEIAWSAMQGIISGRDAFAIGTAIPDFSKQVAKSAVIFADDLIAELNKKEGEK